MFLKIGIIAIISAYLCFWCVWREKKKRLADGIAVAAMVVYIGVVLSITVFRTQTAAGSAELIPFYSYYLILKHNWHYMSLYVVEEALGNVILFIPLGIVFSQLVRKKGNAAYAFAAGLLLSLAIELYQIKSGVGTFEIDDLIHNSLGAVFGCLIGNAVICIKDKDKKQALYNLLPVIIYGAVVGICALISIIFR